MALVELLGSDDDDDPYANLPEWVRRKNICIYIGNGNFFTLALGQELAAFYSLGDMVAGLTFYPELKPVDKNLADEIIGFLTVFSPVDIETQVTKDGKGWAESALSNYVARVYSNYAPLVNISENLSWTGRPIYKEDMLDKNYDPEYKMVFDGTGKAYKYFSQGLNRLGGGDDVHRGAEWSQLNPATLQYLTEQYLGGVGRFFVNTGDAAGDLIKIMSGKDADFNVRKIEGVRALIQQGDDRTQYYRVKAKWDKYKKEAEALEHDMKGYAEDAEKGNAYALTKFFELAQGEGAGRLAIYKEVKGALQKSNSAANKAEGDAKKMLRKLHNEQMKIAVDAMDAVGAK